MGSSLGVADTMALISSKLSNIVPFSCCALFLYSEESEVLRCRFATGVEADVVQQLSIKNGQGLTGWVARNRRPLVNARPSADFEAAGVLTRTALQSALVCPLIFNERFIGTIAVYHSRQLRSTPTITAGSWIAFPSRRRPSSTTRSSSSRRRKTRSPTRSPRCRTRGSCSCT